MSLDYDLRSIKDREVHFPPETDPVVVQVYGSLNRKLTTLIFGCMATHIGTITEENYEEWFNRYLYWCRLATLEKDTNGLTLEDVHNAVGLKTNVFPNKTQQEWQDHMWQCFVEHRFR